MGNSLPHHLYNESLLVGLTVNFGATFTTNARKLESTFGYAVSFSYTGATTPNGNIVLQASNDGSNYSNIDETLINISGSSDTHVINVEKPCYLYVRLKYTRTSGSGGTITCLINGVS